MKSWGIALRLLKRDWRSGELRVIALSVAVAVASLTSVNFFTDRAYLAMTQQSSALLGGDLMFSSSRPLNKDITRLARQRGVQTADAVVFPSMLFHQGKALLGSVKAISDDFPLRGSFTLSHRAFGSSYEQSHGPLAGQVWVEHRILQHLEVEVGQAIQLGQISLMVTAVIQQEPGRGGEMFNVAPRLLFNIKDLPATGLVTEASRVFYQMLFAGTAHNMEDLKKVVTPLIDQYTRQVDGSNARPEITSALRRAEQFLGLAAICSILIATVAIIVATRRYSLRHLDSCAIMRCLGAKQIDIIAIFVGQMFVLALLASAVGCVVGFAAQGIISAVLVNLVSIDLPSGSLWPWFTGMSVGVLTLLSFALPALLQLKDVPSLRVIRREMGNLKAPGLLSYSFGILLIAALILWQAKELNIAVYMISGTALLVFILYILASLVLLGIKQLAKRAKSWWRISLLNISRRRSSSIVQICALSVGIMVLILLTSFRQDFLQDWQNSLPPQAPNRFLINIQPDQLPALTDFFQQQGLAPTDFFPMVRARLIKINGKPINLDDYKDPRSRHRLQREFNLSRSGELPPHNQITAGDWWGDESKGYVSMEQGMAEIAGIALGDRLSFRSGSREIQLTVKNFRKVDWMSFKVNFLAIANPKQIDDLPTSYISSFYLPQSHGDFLGQLIQHFPNITVIDIAAIMHHVRGIISKVVLAVQYVFGFALLAGFIVLYSTLINSMDERSYEYALLRTLGADKQKIRALIVFEFAVQGFLASIFAVAAAVLVLFFIAQFGLKMDYSWPIWPWVYGIPGGALGLVCLAYLGLRQILHRPPMPVLLGN